MLPESLKLYKLIILYFLSRSKHEITNAILSDFILEYGYTDYLSIQETLSSLSEDHMIKPHHTYSTTYYTITDDGRETLSFFRNRIPADTILQINNYLKAKKIQIFSAASVQADYKQIDRNEYLISGKVLEKDHILMEISLNVPTESLAINACKQFKKHEDDIYAYLLQKLTLDDTKKTEDTH